MLVNSSIVYADDTVAYYDAKVKAGSIGGYEFNIEAHEMPSNEVLPIVGKEYFPVTISKLLSEVDNTAPSALYRANTVTKVDVVFAFGKLSQQQQLEQMIGNLERQLNASGNHIDAVVETVETQEMDMQNSFAWITDVNSSIGSITFQNGGATVAMVGNRSRPGKNAMWILQDSENGRQTLSFDYTLSYGDSFSAAGVLCNVTDTGKYIEGYAVVFQNASGTFGNGGAGVWRVKYQKGTNTSQFSGSTKLASLGVSTSGRLTVTMSAEEIVVSGGGMSTPVTVKLPKHYGFGLGFFAEHYSHNCSSIGSFNIRNIKLEKTSMKTLGEAIQDVAWRDNSVRFVIHATDIIPADMEDPFGNDYQYTLAKLLACNAYLVNLGRSVNKDVLEKLVNQISTPTVTKGIWYDNTGLSAAVTKTGDYIIDIAKRLSKPVDWILVNTEVEWETIYKDLENDLPLNFGEHDGTKNSDTMDKDLAKTLGVTLTHLFKEDKILAERWRYRHFNNFYDNSPIQENFHNIWISDPVTIFPNPGKYRINYKRKDNPFHPNVDAEYAFDEYRRWSTDYDYYVGFVD